MRNIHRSTVLRNILQQITVWKNQDLVGDESYTSPTCFCIYIYIKIYPCPRPFAYIHLLVNGHAFEWRLGQKEISKLFWSQGFDLTDAHSMLRAVSYIAFGIGNWSVTLLNKSRMDWGNPIHHQVFFFCKHTYIDIYIYIITRNHLRNLSMKGLLLYLFSNMACFLPELILFLYFDRQIIQISSLSNGFRTWLDYGTSCPFVFAHPPTGTHSYLKNNKKPVRNSMLQEDRTPWLVRDPYFLHLLQDCYHFIKRSYAMMHGGWYWFPSGKLT